MNDPRILFVFEVKRDCIWLTLSYRWMTLDLYTKSYWFTSLALSWSFMEALSTLLIKIQCSLQP